MDPAPPKLLETFVGLLIPPASREDVLGDLHERYTSPLQYIMDAVCTAPLVILSRIRRTTDRQVFLMEAFVLYVSFLSAAWYLDSTILNDQWGLVRLAIPAAVVLVALMLGDAYAKPGKQSPLKPVLCGVAAVGFAFLSQAVFSAGSQELVLPRSIMLCGAGMSLLLVSTLRMLFPPVADRPQGATGPTFWINLAGEPVRMSPDVIGLVKGMASIIVVAVFGAGIGYPSLVRPRFLVAAIVVFVAYRLSKRG